MVYLWPLSTRWRFNQIICSQCKTAVQHVRKKNHEWTTHLPRYSHCSHSAPRCGGDFTHPFEFWAKTHQTDIAMSIPQSRFQLDYKKQDPPIILRGLYPIFLFYRLVSDGLRSLTCIRLVVVFLPKHIVHTYLTENQVTSNILAPF